MESKVSLLRFIDAVIAGDDAAEKEAFTEYTEMKTQELMGLYTEVPVTETDAMGEQGKLLMEGSLDNDIDIRGYTIFVKGKKVGRYAYTGQQDEFGEPSELVFVDLNDNKKYPIKDGSPEELVRFLRKKYLGEA